MIFCFICKQDLINRREYIKHLKEDHQLCGEKVLPATCAQPIKYKRPGVVAENFGYNTVGFQILD
jgi:hypothetical protein